MVGSTVRKSNFEASMKNFLFAIDSMLFLLSLSDASSLQWVVCRFLEIIPLFVVIFAELEVASQSDLGKQTIEQKKK